MHCNRTVLTVYTTIKQTIISINHNTWFRVNQKVQYLEMLTKSKNVTGQDTVQLVTGLLPYNEQDKDKEHSSCSIQVVSWLQYLPQIVPKMKHHYDERLLNGEVYFLDIMHELNTAQIIAELILSFLSERKKVLKLIAEDLYKLNSILQNYCFP